MIIIDKCVCVCVCCKMGHPQKMGMFDGKWFWTIGFEDMRQTLICFDCSYRKSGSEAACMAGWHWEGFVNHIYHVSMRKERCFLASYSFSRLTLNPTNPIPPISNTTWRPLIFLFWSIVSDVCRPFHLHIIWMIRRCCNVGFPQEFN